MPNKQEQHPRGKIRLVAHEIRPPGQALQTVDFRRQRFTTLVDGGFYLSQRRKGNLLLMGHQFFIVGQLGKKAKPHQRIFFGNLHDCTSLYGF